MKPPAPIGPNERRDLARETALRLADAESKLATTIAGVNAAAAFGAYAGYRLIGMGNEAMAKFSRPAPAAVEYAAWLLFPHFGRGADRDAGKIQAVIDALEECGTALVFAEMFPPSLETDGPDKLAAHLRLHSGMVRGSAYPQQVKRRIEAVLRPFEAELAAIVGIGPWRAFEIAAAIAAQVEDNLDAMREEFRRTVAQGQLLAGLKRKLTEEEQATFDAIATRLRSIVDGWDGNWVPSREQIAARVSGLTSAEWTAFRSCVGLTPESRQRLTRVVDVQDRPVYFVDDDHALLVHNVSVFDAIFTHFDDVARHEPSLRDRYGQQIAGWMEEEIEKYLLRLFPKSAVFRNACFPDPDNTGGETEADVVVVWGPFLIVAEAKGKRVPKDATRGSRAKLRQAVQQNIQDAFFQARRVVRVLERDKRIEFKERLTGRKVVVEDARLQRVMPISLTLQHLSGIPTQLAQTEKLGLFKGRAYPWSASIDDLETITRFVQFPDAFLHYIERRTTHQSSDVMLSGDELDIFAQYLDTRLHPDFYESNKEFVGHEGGRMIAFNGGEERFAAIYNAEWYGDTPGDAEPVELKLPLRMRAVLDELRNRDDDGARWTAFAILGLTSGALNRMDRTFGELRETPIPGKQMRRLTAREGDVVINLMAHRGMDEPTFVQNMVMRTRLEHYRLK